MYSNMYELSLPLCALLMVAGVFLIIKFKKPKNQSSSITAAQKIKMQEDIKKIEKALYDGEG